MDLKDRDIKMDAFKQLSSKTLDKLFSTILQHE